MGHKVRKTVEDGNSNVLREDRLELAFLRIENTVAVAADSERCLLEVNAIKRHIKCLNHLLSCMRYHGFVPQGEESEAPQFDS